jgi:hypothetical protein
MTLSEPRPGRKWSRHGREPVLAGILWTCTLDWLTEVNWIDKEDGRMEG